MARMKRRVTVSQAMTRTAMRWLGRVPLMGRWVRGVERRVQRLIDEKSYLASQVNRLTSAMHANSRVTSQDQEFTSDGQRLQIVARQVVRNVDIASTLVDRAADKTIGWRGIWPQVRTKNANLNAEIEAVFRRDARRIGMRGESWRALQRVLVRELVTVGEAFAMHGVLEGRFVVGTFEPEQLATTVTGVGSSDEVIANGVRYDRWGRPVAYMILDMQPGSWGMGMSGMVGWREVPADQVCHCLLKNRPSQWRGISPFDSTLMSINDIGDTDYAELVGMKQGAYVGLIIEQPEGDALGEMGAEDETDSLGDTQRTVNLQPGGIQTISGKPHFLDANRPGNQYLPYIMARLKRIAARFGIPYNSASGDTSQANYSSLRADQVTMLGSTEDRQVALTEQVLAPLFEAWLTWAVLTGEVRLRGYDVAEIMESLEWQYPGVAPVNPKESAAADVLEVGLGVKTWSQACADRGLDAREQAGALKAEAEMLAEYGLSREQFLAQAGVLGAFAQGGSGDGKDGTTDGTDATDGKGKAKVVAM